MSYRYEKARRTGGRPLRERSRFLTEYDRLFAPPYRELYELQCRAALLETLLGVVPEKLLLEIGEAFERVERAMATLSDPLF